MTNILTIVNDIDNRALIMKGGQVWNGTTFVALDATSFAAGLLTPVRNGTADLWDYTVPPTLPSGDMALVIYEGTAPNITDTPFEGGNFYWDNTSVWLPRTSLAGKDVTLVTRDNYGNIVAGAETWVTKSTLISDIIVGKLLTDEDGEVRLQLTPGNYWRWASKAGHAFTNPQAFVVNA